MSGFKKNKVAVSSVKRKRISLLRRSDRLTVLSFCILFVASLVAFWYIQVYHGFTTYTALPVMAIPFFIIGLAFYFISKRYLAAVFILALSVVAFFILPTSVLFIVYLLVCTEGVAQLVEIIQRAIFYDILDSIEHVNIKQRLTLKDKAVVFLFNVPVDLDTRNLVIDRSITRNKLPWKDMFNSMMLALLFCMFLWIYLFLNPNFALGTEGVPIYTFTIVLYLSLIVMPWSIFSTFNARIDTEYRDFKLYSGILGTFKRMFLPVFAALIFLIIAVSEGPDNLYYVGMSLIMIVVIISFTSVMYYTTNEISVVGDILDKWNEFQPSELYSGYTEVGRKSSLDDGVPGTPRRDPSDCFIPVQKL